MTRTSSKSSWRSCRPTSRRRTWEAFRRFGVDGVPAGQVAEELGLSENAVILAKSRVLKRLREEAGELLGIISLFRDRFDAEPAFHLQ